MKGEGIALRFEQVQEGCCSLCNPVQLADYEQPCVRVARHDQPLGGFCICLGCIERLALGARGEPSILVLSAEVSLFMRELMRQCGGNPDDTIH